MYYQRQKEEQNERYEKIKQQARERYYKKKAEKNPEKPERQYKKTNIITDPIAGIVAPVAEIANPQAEIVEVAPVENIQ
jgi:hypothetical protein